LELEKKTKGMQQNTREEMVEKVLDYPNLEVFEFDQVQTDGKITNFIEEAND